MKLRFILPSVIFLFCGLALRAQVTEMYYQGFETGETTRFSVSPTTAGTYSTTYYVSGNRSLMLQQSTTENDTLFLDELDFTSNTSLYFISLYFDHICTVPANQGGDASMCRLYFKRPIDNDWQLMTSMYYNRTNGGAGSFQNFSSFTVNAYPEWLNIGLSNESWKSERFDLNDVMTNVTQQNRKLRLMFVLKKKTGTGALGKWLFDNIKVMASPSAMVTPKITMVHYPELINHPSSRGARIELEPSTTLAAGINPDSVYLMYRVGSDPTPIRLPMTQVAGNATHYEGRIPFYGYDTMMAFYCVARDNTTNANMVTFPSTDNSWVTYKCVRGVEQPGVETPGFTGTSSSNNYPFRATANGCSEWVFDSATLATAGYGPGAMTAMRFTFASHTNTVSRQRLQVKMKNVPTNYAVDLSNLDEIPFTKSFMHVVYDNAFVINEANSGMSQTMQFEDTFFYAGKDIVMKVTYANPTNITSSTIKTIPTTTAKSTVYSDAGDAEYGGNPFTTDMFNVGNFSETKRPALVMTQNLNQPLLYDMGFDTNRTSQDYGLVRPNRDVPMVTGNHSVQVKLKNFGALTANAIRISYTIDDTIFGHYDWSGTMAGGVAQAVTIAPSVPLPAGFHYLKVWVEDTLTASGQRYRDHEPYNDTVYSQFVVCDGPMNGVRNIGGANADFNTMEEFLFAVSRCDIDDSLVVRLAPGTYAPFTMPAVSGLTPTHYIAFEPQGNGNVVFESNGVAPSIVNLENVANIRFRNLRFLRRSGALTDMVTLGMTSHNCHFEGCVFADSLNNPSASMRVNSMINSGFANGLLVSGCTFIGGKVGVDVKGQASDILAQGNTVSKNIFYNQYENALRVENQNGVMVEGNEMYDVLSSSSYVLLLNGVYGTSQVLANKIYTKHGGGGIGVSNAQGTSGEHVLIANNMLVNEDDGSANQMRTLMNIIQANWTDVVYNSMKMTAPSRSNIATATFGGGTLQNSRFLNNIVVCLDNSNYALNYASGYTNNNTIGHNVYYTLGTIMNRRSNVGYADVENWQTIVPEDSLSISTNPNFLNGSLVDLRTYNRLIKGVGLPLSTVPTDMFDTLRNTTASCPGAFEFVSLRYDFEPEALESPEMETCYMPSSVELKVRLRNSGTMAYNGSGMNLYYQVNGGAVQTVPVTITVPAEDTVTFSTNQMLQLPANGTRDSVHSIRVWVFYANDPNQTNDTNTFAVKSKYHPTTPADMNVQVNYAEQAVLTPTVGINDWKVYGYQLAPRRKSEIYWYHDSTDAAPFYVGGTLTTDTLRTDTVFYFRQKRDKALVRFTQVEVSHANNTHGLTPSMPYWMNNNRKAALQLTNVGDAPACLYGDSIITASPTANINNKIYTFTDSIWLQPGQSLVVQYATGNSANPAATIHTGFTLALSANTTSFSKVGFIYKRNGVVEDVVSFDTANRVATWRSHNVPNYVWRGDGVMSMNVTYAGIIRTAFEGMQSDWMKATTAHPMFISTIDSSWIMYTDNGCDGYFATANVSMLAPPDADIEVGVPQLPASSCGLGMEDVSVMVHNYGIAPVTGLVLNYCAGADTVTETVPTTIGANGVVNYTFTTQLNLAVPYDSLVTVKVWADAVTGDPMQTNDTNVASVLALYTPLAPPLLSTRTVAYAERDTVTVPFAAGRIPVWYDYDGIAVDTGYTNVSEILYVGGNRGYSYMIVDNSQGIVGTGTSTNGNTAYPSPYQPNNKFAKQQYIYSASELRAAGLQVGYVDSIAFELKQILGNNVNTITFNEYAISMGSTNDTTFANTSDWKSVSQVYRRAPMSIRQADCNTWVTHQFDTPYYWDGESSLVVQVLHRISTAVTSGVKSAYTAKNNTTLVKNGNTEPSPSLEEFSGAATNRGSNRPNIRINNTFYGCESPMTPYTVQLVNIPAVDMAVLWPNGTDTLHYNSCDSISIYVNVRNQGQASSTDTKLYYFLDNQPKDSTIVTGTMASGATEHTLLLKQPLMPGRHFITVAVSGAGDNITSNDTISRAFLVRFCGGTYTIAAANGDYHSFSEAIDTLNVAGIEGAVTFNIAPGIYTEQVVLSSVYGTSATNTISFVGTGDAVLLKAPTTQSNNYVFYLDSASNVSLQNFRIEARPTATGAAGNYANALVIRSGDNIHVNQCTIRVKGTVDNANASCVILKDGVSNLDFSYNMVDSGYFSMKTVGTSTFANLSVTNNTFNGFRSQGLNLRGVSNLDIVSNEITSGAPSNLNGRGFIGLYLAQTTGTFNVKKNKIYLIDTKNGAKRGIQMENISCTALSPGLVVNNMVGCSGTGTQGLTPAKSSGIWIDSLSNNVNILFNTVRVFNGTPAANTLNSDVSYAFFSGNDVSSIKVMNNIFSNFSKGYAYYVSERNTVTLSNHNGYYTESNRPFFWKNIVTSLSALQNTNHDENGSVFSEPFFVADNDLHLVMTNFVSLADYSPEVPEDIDGNVRMEVPAPTIGAHEMDIFTHDMAVVRITKPIMPTNYNFNPPAIMPPNIETDPVRVVARFYNNGRSTETNVQWYAYIEGHEATTRTPNRNLGIFSPAETKIDSIMMPTVPGIIDTHTVHVVVVLPNDSSIANNDRTAPIYLAPAYNLAATKVHPATTGCNLQNTTVKITLQNKGYKDIPVGMPLKIGYRAEIQQPTGLTIPTLPTSPVEENITAPAVIYMNQTSVIDFATHANFYPTDTATNIKVRLIGWVHSDQDYTSSNDTTVRTNASQSTVFDSWYTPSAPIGFDTIFDYGTWGAVRAKQINSRPIRWYRDSTAAAFYSPGQYAASCWWTNTPQYFHDSTYYLNCLSDKGCASHFSPVTVHVAPPIANDMAFESVLAPLGDRVYMENDTVRVRIKNYGSNTQNNVPIHYELWRGNTMIQDATENCTASIASNQTYDYTFHTLLNIPTPTQTQNYTLRVWTDLATDAVRRNDTLRVAHSFRSLAESTYTTAKPNSPSFDITRVSFNEIDFDLPPLGRGLTDVATYDIATSNNPECPVLHVTRGTSDSLIVEVTPVDADSRFVRCRYWAFIDFDRSGTFTADEVVVNGDDFYSDQIVSKLVSISNNASYGYMRMRIAVGLYSDFPASAATPYGGIPNDKDGHNIDFMIFVNAEAPATDLAVTQIVNPRSYLIRDDLPREISVRIANKGTTPITNPELDYSFECQGHATVRGTVTYNGTLQPGRSGIVTLPEHSFQLGVTYLTVSSSLENDAVQDNNTLHYEYNRFHKVVLVFDDDFEGADMWYAPTGRNAYSRNYWQRGAPTKQRINAAYSGENAWVTDLNSNIVTGKRGNVSYLYSPIINISQIKPDTLSFRLRRNLQPASKLQLQFYNFENRWVNLIVDSVINWYNNEEEECFDQTTSGSDYDYYWIPTNMISGDFQENLQFRFVYTTPLSNSATSAYGEGCAIDNFCIGRARRNVDVGVVAITQPTAPSYGQTIYPEVVVHNYGLDTIREVTIGYTHYGTSLPKENTFTCLLPPDGDATFLFNSPFIVSSDFPDTFHITAFTIVNMDIYNDNDTTTRIYSLSPLENDISAHSLIYPLDHAVAGDSLQVTLRIRNFGISPISTATAVYTVNGQNRVEEQVDFEALLGRPLASMEYFNYAFNQKFRASMGIMKVESSISSPQNDYPYNDTVSKRVEGVNFVTDLAAAAVVVDSTSHGEVRFILVIENRGARGVNGFEVGFYIDNDISTLRRETYNRPTPLPALTTDYYRFNTAYPERSVPYSNVTAFVHAIGDNDPANDTTSEHAEWYFDLEVVKLIVEENAQPDCKLYVQVRNHGNIPLVAGDIRAKANVNGNNVSKSFEVTPPIEPNQTRTLLFDRRIPKSPTRSYVGSVTIAHVNDHDTSNNQTSLIEVVGRFDPHGVPVVEVSEFTLDQNYPNPFSGTTTIPFSLPNDAEVHFFIIDAMGHVVSSFDRHYEAGQQTLEVDLSAQPAGIYYYGIEVDGHRCMKKMILR